MIYLASQSKIRRQLLSNAGVAFLAQISPLDEEAAKSKHRDLSPHDMAQHLALAKARALSEIHPQHLVIGADQTLEYDGEVLHKAKSKSEAEKTLTKLSGQHHLLHSAIAITKGSELKFCHLSTASLKMRKLSPKFIATYLKDIGDDAFASPGAYQIEKSGAQLFEDISGDHFAILGLPLLPILAFLRQIGELPI
jgi:septum formation protein